MSVSVKNDKLSKEQTYELEEVQSVQRDHASVTYETLDTIYPESMKEHSGHSMEAGCGTSDGHETHLLQTNKSSGRKLLFVVTSIATVAVLLVALVVLVVILLSPAATEAEEERCSPITEVSNGKIVNFTGSGHGDTFQVQCNNTSKLVGPALVTCYSSNQWSRFPRCVPKACDPFVPPNHGKTSLSFFVSNPKHDEAEKFPRNNTWDDKPGTNPMQCGIPHIPSNGSLVSINGTTFQSRAFVRCDVGFTMIGNANIRCLSNESWSETPKCVPVSCGLPDEPLNGAVATITGTTYKKTAVIKCNEGFIVSGSDVITCLSNGKWTQGAICLPTVTDCYDIQKSANKTPSGIYNITLWRSRQTIQVYCDMDTDEGGWTVFQNRYDGSVDFYNSYEQYENGFGNLNGEFWLGLKYIEEMSIQGRTKLRIDLTDADNSTAYLKYRGFFLSPKNSGYMLNIAGSSGLGYTFRRYNNGMQFSTYNYSPYGNNGTTCAVNYRGAWWYDHSYCYGNYINLNGYYSRSINYGMIYYPVTKTNRYLKTSKMMMKRF